MSKIQPYNNYLAPRAMFLSDWLDDISPLWSSSYFWPRYSGLKVTTSDEKTLTLSLDLPGYKASDVDVTLDREVLTVSVKKDGISLVSSRSVGAIDPDAVRAKLEDGVLTINLQRAKGAEPRKIQVR